MLALLRKQIFRKQFCAKKRNIHRRDLRQSSEYEVELMLISRRIDAKRKRSQIACILSLILFYLSRQFDEGKKRHEKNVKRKNNKPRNMNLLDPPKWVEPRNYASRDCNSIYDRFWTIESLQCHSMNSAGWHHFNPALDFFFHVWASTTETNVFSCLQSRAWEVLVVNGKQSFGLQKFVCFLFLFETRFFNVVGASFFAPSNGSWRYDEPCVALCNGIERNEIKGNVFTRSGLRRLIKSHHKQLLMFRLIESWTNL